MKQTVAMKIRTSSQFHGCKKSLFYVLHFVLNRIVKMHKILQKYAVAKAKQSAAYTQRVWMFYFVSGSLYYEQVAIP